MKKALIFLCLVAPWMTLSAAEPDRNTKAVTAGPVGSFAPAWILSEDPGTGFEGSPAYCDLDGDGQDEAIVAVSAGTAPLPQDPAYIEVVDPRTGSRLWRAAQGNSGFAYPLCRDVNADGVLDILTAGRLGDVRALSGVDGTVLWSLNDLNPGALADFVNTYSPVSAPERPDVVFVSSGGGLEITPGQRHPGVVLAFDLDGKILARWDEPNGAEMYSSPAVMVLGPSRKTLLLVVGSGGETLPGSLHFLLYNTLLKRFIPYAEAPSSCETGGFVASPMLGDINGDRFAIPEVVAVDLCGEVAAFNLLGHKLWSQDTRWPYVFSNPLLADLNADGVLDVAISSTAVNPSIPETFVLLDGALDTYDGPTGTPLWSIPLKLPIFSSPVSADVDGDGVEDVWVATQNFFLPSELTVYSGHDGTELAAYGSVNWAGTPILNDADGDGAIDALVMDAPPSFEPPLPLVNTILLNLPGVAYDPGASWSGFRGPDHDGYRR